VKLTISTGSLRDDFQIVEVGHRIAFRPEADFPGLGERCVLEFIEPLPVQPDGKEIAFGRHAQFAPLVLRHGRLLAVSATAYRIKRSRLCIQRRGGFLRVREAAIDLFPIDVLHKRVNVLRRSRAVVHVVRMLIHVEREQRP
jgi:hypothetical protein